MTEEEKVKIFIKKTFQPVEDKPGYVWFNKRNFQIISIETLQKILYGTLQAIDINKNLCDSCINNGCMFQSGIVRSHCDFYKAESEDKEAEA